MRTLWCLFTRICIGLSRSCATQVRALVLRLRVSFEIALNFEIDLQTKRIAYFAERIGNAGRGGEKAVLLHLDPMGPNKDRGRRVYETLADFFMCAPIARTGAIVERYAKHLTNGKLRQALCRETRKAQNGAKKLLPRTSSPSDSIAFYEVEDIPRQADGFNCGPFMLTYMDFFSYRLPRSVTVPSVGLRVPAFDFGGLRHPTFLSHSWFPASNPEALRRELAVSVLKKLREAVTIDTKDSVVDTIDTYLSRAECARADSVPYRYPGEVMIREWKQISVHELDEIRSICAAASKCRDLFE